MGISLSKGGNVNLTKEAGGSLAAVTVGLGWDARSTDGQPFDLDASAIGVGADGKVVSDDFFVFFNNLASKDGSVKHKDDFYAQCKMAWEKVAKLLQSQGASVSDIVKATSYVTDIRYRQEMRKCRTEVFTGKPLPPHTLLNVVQLARPGMMFEVDVVAAVAAK